MRLSQMLKTQILDLPQLQTLLFKYWYLGFTLDDWKPEDSYTKTVRKCFSFANCIYLEMPLSVYLSFLRRIAHSLTNFKAGKVLSKIIDSLEISRMVYLSYQDFCGHYIELLQFVIDSLDTQTFIQLTKSLYKSISSNKEPVKMLDLDKIKPLSSQKLQIAKDHDPRPTAKRFAQEIDEQEQDEKVDLNNLEERISAMRVLNNRERGVKDQYPVAERLKATPKVQLSCFSIGQHQLQDYTANINSLHKQLLSKIRISKGKFK